MHDELTRQDIALMEQELEDRITRQRPELIAEVQRCREFGDLSENFEYKEAKRAKNRNESRIRYLQNMIKTAHIVAGEAARPDTVGLFDKVTVLFEDEAETQVIQIVTTVRTDPSMGLISKESPLGKAVLGRRAGERVCVQVNDRVRYFVRIERVEPAQDDGSAPLLPY